MGLGFWSSLVAVAATNVNDAAVRWPAYVWWGGVVAGLAIGAFGATLKTP